MLRQKDLQKPAVAAETARLHTGDTPHDLAREAEVSALNLDLVDEQGRTSPSTLVEILQVFDDTGLMQDPLIADAIRTMDTASHEHVSSLAVAVQILCQSRYNYNQAIVLAHELDDIVQGKSSKRVLFQEGVTDMGTYATGGFGKVTLERSGSDTIAKKTTHAEVYPDGRGAPEAKEALSRARFEAELLAALQGTPGIFEYVGSGDVEVDGRIRAMLRTKFVPGRDFAHDLKNAGPDGLNESYVLRVMLHTAVIHRALHNPEVNRTGDIIVNRDLNERNIRVRNDGRGVMIGDFGLAKRVKTQHSKQKVGSQEASTGGDHHETTTEQTLGSHYYAAPEQYENPTEVGPAADVFALAVTLYKGLTGTYPFPKKRKQFLAAVKAGTFNDSVLPEPLREIIKKCFAYEPTDRASAEDLARKILEYIPGWNKQFTSLEEFIDAPADRKCIHAPLTFEMIQQSESAPSESRNHASGILFETRRRLADLNIDFTDGPTIIPVLPDRELQQKVGQLVGEEPDWSTATASKKRVISTSAVTTIAAGAAILIAGAWYVLQNDGTITKKAEQDPQANKQPDEPSTPKIPLAIPLTVAEKIDGIPAPAIVEKVPDTQPTVDRGTSADDPKEPTPDRVSAKIPAHISWAEGGADITELQLMIDGGIQKFSQSGLYRTYSDTLENGGKANSFSFEVPDEDGAQLGHGFRFLSGKVVIGLPSGYVICVEPGGEIAYQGPVKELRKTKDVVVWMTVKAGQELPRGRFPVGAQSAVPTSIQDKVDAGEIGGAVQVNKNFSGLRLSLLPDEFSRR